MVPWFYGFRKNECSPVITTAIGDGQLNILFTSPGEV